MLFFISEKIIFTVYMNLTISCSVSWKLIIPFNVYRIFICKIVYFCTQAWKGGEEKKCLVHTSLCMCLIATKFCGGHVCICVCILVRLQTCHIDVLVGDFFWVSFTLCCLIISGSWIPQERTSCLHLKRKRNFMGLPTDFGDYHCLPDVSLCTWQYKSRQAVAAMFIT